MGASESTPLLPSKRAGGSSALSYVLVTLSLTLVLVFGFGLWSGIQGALIRNSIQNDVLPGLIQIATEPSCATEPKEEKRRYDAYHKRHDAALYHLAQAIPCHENNGDEALYSSNYLAQYSKGMPHDANGLVDPAAYRKLLKAVESGNPNDYAAIPQAGTRDFTNPQAAYAFTLMGADSHTYHVPPAPAFSSAERAADIIENYWMALTRDIPFSDYATNPLTQAAVADMSTLSDYRGPPVTAANLFRGTSPGCLIGPFISQFMYLDTSMGANPIEMRILPYQANEEFMTNHTEWLRIQRGEQPNFALNYESSVRYIINSRDLAAFVRIDVLFQAYFCATLKLLSYNGGALKSSLPYQTRDLNQMGFGTFGGPFGAGLVAKIGDVALHAAWFQKWNVHRTLRPEVMAQRIHLHKTGVMNLNIHADALNSAALNEVFTRYGTYLLPQAFPEGSPLHPSYCAGHATVAGASVTLLKAIFNETFVIPNPVIPNPSDPSQLIPYVGPPLTVGNELNKLAWNIGNGRVQSGVHFRSDSIASLKLGEQVAIEYLRDLKTTFNEPFEGWSFRDFDGNEVFI